MKIEIRRDRVWLTLESNDTETHALMTDHHGAVEAALASTTSWFNAEVERLLAPPQTAPIFDKRGKMIGRRIVEANASPLVYFGRTFTTLDEFKQE